MAIVSRISNDVTDKRDIGSEPACHFNHELETTSVYVYVVHYEKVFKACSSKYQGDGPTGILLVYPQHCIHLLEGPMEIIKAIMYDLKELDSTRYVEWKLVKRN